MVRQSLTDHGKPAVFGFWCPLGMPNSKTVHAGAPAATDKSNGYIEYEALHHHLDMCSYVETQAITHIAFSLPCRLC